MKEISATKAAEMIRALKTRNRPGDAEKIEQLKTIVKIARRKKAEADLTTYFNEK